ncbi:MAG: response regulator, partial [Bacteroidetes bacterium]
MTMLRTILIDDEPRGLNSLQKLLELNCPDVVMLATCTNVDDAIEKIQQLHPDLIFLDIAMPVKNGFDLLKGLRDVLFEVIFVTAHNQFMVEAFHFSAVDYLLKPVDDELLIDAVKRAKKRINEKSGSKNIETFLHNMKQKQTPQN